MKNLVFFGSDEFSLSALHACLDSSHKLSLIVTTPAQKKGRGLVLTPNAIQILAEEQGLPFIAPPDLKEPSVIQEVRNQKPDIFVVSSYGKYIPSDYLSMPKAASLNIHPSLLPKYRGSGPIQWAILNGDSETGISIIEVAKKLDAGDIFVQKRIAISPSDDYITLTRRLADMSYEILLGLLEGLSSAPLKRTPQEESQSCYARKLTKDDARLSFNEPAVILDRKVRGLKPWPGTYVPFRETRLALVETEMGTAVPQLSAVPGTLLRVHNTGSIDIQTADGILRIKKVQPAGKGCMSAADFARGRRLEPGFQFETL